MAASRKPAGEKNKEGHMGITVYWLQGGACGGDTMSLLSVESPDVIELLGAMEAEVLWHPSLSNITARQHADLVKRIVAGKQTLDILVFEGSVINGPEGTGLFDTVGGKPKRDLIKALARKAGIVIAAGTCAAFGGIGAEGEIEASGLQFRKGEKGGLLGAKFRSGAGLPVLNLAGCPCHHDVLSGTFSALAAGIPMELDEFNRPLDWYGMMVHQGCTRNEYHEYRVEEKDFAEKGCLFFFMGCHGPLVNGPCNKFLRNQRSSKTRVGVPCFGCTSPDFPPAYPFFETRNIEDIPLALPDGVNRAHYLAYKGIAAAAAPERLKQRITEV